MCMGFGFVIESCAILYTFVHMLHSIFFVSFASIMQKEKWYINKSIVSLVKMEIKSLQPEICQKKNYMKNILLKYANVLYELVSVYSVLFCVHHLQTKINTQAHSYAHQHHHHPHRRHLQTNSSFSALMMFCYLKRSKEMNRKPLNLNKNFVCAVCCVVFTRFALFDGVYIIVQWMVGRNTDIIMEKYEK